MDDVEQLRERLKNLGYLSRGMERWFALDPWSSRTFWSELFLVSAKAAVLVAPFMAAPAVAVMTLRNQPLTMGQMSLLGALYVAAAFVAVFGVVVATALVVKLNPAFAVRSTRFLNALSIILGVLLVFLIGGWWFAFDDPARSGEVALGASLCLLAFFVAVTVFSAALLSFSIHESGEIPPRRRSSRAIPLSIATLVLVLLLFIPAYSVDRDSDEVPLQIVTEPSSHRAVLIAVDGLSADVLLASELQRLLPIRVMLTGEEFRSPPERWASIGTGIVPDVHGVRAIEGVRLGRTRSILQNVSSADFVLLHAAPVLGLARRQPLPPAARERDYVWEIVSGRGVSAVAVNWWASDQKSTATLWSTGQESLFAASRRDRNAQAAALSIDRSALTLVQQRIADRDVRLASVYLPALDIVLNRLASDSTARLALSVEILQQLTLAVRSLQSAGFEVIVVGLPGVGQSGSGVLALTLPMSQKAASPYDVAPTLLDYFGFPKSREMPGHSLLQASQQPAIPTFGARRTSPPREKIDEEYYESLRSLGYIQ